MTKTEIEPINSYYRLLVHRVARFYGLEHVLDPQRSTVMILSKTPETQMYCDGWFGIRWILIRHI
jgi:hypothetical protein